MPAIAKHILSAAAKGDVQQLYQYLVDQERTIAKLQARLANLVPGPVTGPVQQLQPQPPDTSAIRSALESDGSAPLNVTGLVGRLSESQDARIVRLSSHPDPLQVTYDLYVLAGTPDTIWGINRDVNPPTRYQITVTSSEYADNVFRIYDNTDTSKKLAFDVGTLVGAGAVRTMKVPNVDQTLAGREVDNAFATVTQTFNAGLHLQTAGTLQSDVLAALLGGLQLTVRGSSGTDTLSAEEFIKVNTGGGAVTLNLPAAPLTGQFYFIFDDANNAAVNNITVNGNGKNINGAASKVINTNRGGLGMFYNGTQWDAWLLVGA